MKNSIIFNLLLLFALLLSTALSAQTIKDKNTKTWHVETTDGNEYYGEKRGEDSLSITLLTTTIGELKIPKNKIKRLEEVDKDQLLNGSFLVPNAHSSRYFWSPNGFGLKKGEGYYQNTWVMLNQVSLGVSNNLTIGVGIIPTFLFGAGGEGTPFWITPKVQFPIANGKAQAGLGVIYMNLLGGDNGGFGGLGMAYGVTTFGDRNRNLTVGLGYGFADGNWSKSPTITLSGMYRVGKRGYFMTENWFISAGSQTIAVILVGGRYTAKVLAFDFGLGRPISFNSDFGDVGFFAIPWLGVNVPFGNRTK